MQQQITALRTVAATDAIGGVAATTTLPHPLLFHGTAAVVAICASAQSRRPPHFH
jgi:protocatechuate 3,4-dioxygenase beta subunit